MKKCIDCKKDLSSAVAVQVGNKWETHEEPYTDYEIEVLQGRCNGCTHEHVIKEKDMLPSSYGADEIYRIMYAQDRDNIVLRRMRDHVCSVRTTTHLDALQSLKDKRATLDRWDESGGIYLLQMSSFERNATRDIAVTRAHGSINPHSYMWLARLVNSTPHKTGLYKGYSTVYWQRTIALASHGTARSAIAWLNGLSGFQWADLEEQT